MIAIDTNIIVRWITQDDPHQAKRVERLFRSHHASKQILICDAVLVELEWVLSSVYDFTREQICTAFEKILLTRQFTFRNKETVRRAVEQYRDGERDLSDCMIGELGREQNAKTHTFDKGMKRNANFVVLS